MKRALILLLLLLLTVGPGAAPALAAQPRVGISCPYEPSLWPAAVYRTAETAAEELELNYVLKAASTAQEQAEDLEMFVRQGFDAIVLLPIDDSLEDVARRAMADGVRLYCFVCSPGALEPDFGLLADGEALGELAADAIGAQLTDGGRVAILGCAAGGEVLARQVAAFRSALQARHPQVEIVGEWLADGPGREDGARTGAQILAEVEDIDAAFACTEGLAAGLTDALAAQDRLEELRALSCTGGSKSLLEWAQALPEELHFSVQTCSPYAVEEMLRLCAGLLQGEETADAPLPARTLEREDFDAWLAVCGAADAPF